MTQTSYIIHLPTGSRIHAHDAAQLENILSLNVCRVFRGNQIRIEPVFHDPQPAHDKSYIRKKIREFAESLCG